MTPEHEFACIVNLDAKAAPMQTVTFLEVARLAFPHKVDNPNVTFVITYRKAESEPHQGTLNEDGSVTIKKDGATSFTVVDATKS